MTRLNLFEQTMRNSRESGVKAQALYDCIPGQHTRRRALSKVIAGFFSVISVAGCAVGPNYVTPTITLAPFHNHVSTASTERLQAPSLDNWWTGFNDPTLVAIVQRTLTQNLDLAAALARVEQARAAASGAGAQLLPTIDLDASATAQHQSTLSPYGTLAKTFPGFSRDQREYNVGAVASWEIDLAGGLRRNAAAANDEVAAAEADRLGTRVTAAADAADAYIQIRGLQARLSVAQDQIATDARLLELVEARRHAGSADDREIAQAQALLKQARATVPTLRTALEAQLNRLDVLMGDQPGANARELGDSVAIPSVPPIGNIGTPVDVLRRRPDIIAAERRLAESNERIGAAISEYYPKVSLSGVLGFDSISANHLFTAQAFQPIGTGALRWRLFDFGKVDAEVAHARGAYAEALAVYRQAALKATEDVENALVTLSQTQTRALEVQDEVTALTRARDLSERAYKAGAITLTDVLDADRLLLVARDDLDGTRSNAARAAVQTFRALGGGWAVSASSQSTAVDESVSLSR
ncbi:efflux transporter outer membrane subunit [Paraburkholderia caribensis]|uniref:efflux transporter outer membrane subunit n=1 Tax=Paraburkholderia caribensis TaxID=75105 RepID=UPI001CAAA39B|nr:efflux transporter outer membrane subunit [Paraburkholderia caribensis]CAG9249500.1 Efflux transporter, outer membrane factor (OMF) lipoprotein, NodT family [Paraburkholderia caribensis]